MIYSIDDRKNTEFTKQAGTRKMVLNCVAVCYALILNSF
jgi:hypothetical protein